MAKRPPQQDPVWASLIEVTASRSRFFLKYSERFDRRLYAEVDMLILIALKFRQKNLMDPDPAQFRKLMDIKRQLLEAGQAEYLDFP